jgi:membrane-associated phospholipid phosphatase
MPLLSHHLGGRCLVPIALVAALGLSAPAAAGEFDQENRIATAVQLALPVIAGFCAVRQDRISTYMAGFAVETLSVQGLKYGLGDAAINQRPRGADRGFPSGHAALAMYGATNIARKCVPDKPVLGLLAYGAALAVAASRVHSGNHTAGQAMSGLAIGYFSNGITLGATPDGVSVGFSMSF